ncbi:hypothetical protein SLS59_002456 [Nothophoma quercina]|uniref:Glycine zipper 2TM domain-containing protein n=1 Tax=Nothophoma quercina TaxID=749835 RepID=A0ABR3RT89_9PLEO
MASAEYYLGSQATAQQFDNQQSHTAYTPQQMSYQQQPPAQPWPRQQYNNPPYAGTPPPSYSPYAPQQQKQPQAYPFPPPPPPPQQQQYPGKGYQGSMAPYFPPPPQQSSGYLGAPLQPVRSYSQPPARVRFAEEESTALGSESESDSGSSPRHRHRHRRSRDRGRDYDSPRDVDRDGDYSEGDYDRSRGGRTKTHQKKHENRDTFLGAGAGGIIGDAIFPGLGTAAGLIIGGLGGRKYAKDKRSHSEEGRPHRHRDAYREGRDEAREDREYRRHRHRDAYHEGKEESRRDRARDSGYGYDERDMESGYGRDDGHYNRYDEGHKQRGKNRKYGRQGWDEGSATFKSGTAVR